MAGSLFAGCCGLGDMESLEEKSDLQAFSPILSLDKYVADWTYDYFKKDYDEETSCCAKIFQKFPKRKDLDITIHWEGVKFTHNEPVEVGVSEKNAKDESTSEPPNGEMVGENSNQVQPEAKFDPRNKMNSLHQEAFSVKFENTTDKTCETTLSSERTVTASYEVDIHSSVQVGQTVQVSLEVGGEESMAKAGASYEFNKMLEQYKGEKKTKENSTTTSTVYPVEVKAKSVTEAKFVTSYLDFKKTFNISSEFSGRISMDLCEKKKRGKKRFYKYLGLDVCDVFTDLKKQDDSPIAKSINIVGARPDWVVTYTSSATFSSSTGVDQNVRILTYPLKEEEKQSAPQTC